MADGLRVWDAGATLIFDETTPVIKFLGTLSVGQSYTGATQQGVVTDPRFTQFAQHVPFWARNDGGFTSDGTDCEFRFEGNNLIWTFPRADPGYLNSNGQPYYYARPNIRIIYGIR